MNTRRLITAMAVAATLLVACSGKEARVSEHLEKGKSFLMQEDLEKARVEFKNVLQIDPKHVEANFEMGQLLEKQQNWRNAAGQYQRVTELDPQHNAARIRLARLYLLGGGRDEAQKMIDEVLARAPQDADALAVAAGIAARKGETDKALALAQTALKVKPGHADAVMLLAGAHANAKHPDEAIAVLREGLTHDRNNIAMRAVLADLHAQRNEIEPATQLLREIIGLEPKVLAHRTRLAAFFVRHKRLDDGETVLRDAVANDAENNDAKLALVNYLATQRDRATAEKQLDTFIAAHPEIYPLRFAMASLRQAGGDTDGTRQVLDAIVKDDGTGPDGLRARNALAVLAVQRDDRDGALALLGEVLKENPKDNDALSMRASLALEKRDVQTAIADLRTVLKDQPTAPRVLRMLATAHLLNNEPELARDYLQKGVEANPQEHELRHFYAQYLAQANDHDRAIEQYRLLVTQAPDNGLFVDGLFKAQAAKGDWTAAEKTAAQLKQAHPDHPLGYYFSGLLLQQKKEFAASVKEFEIALEKKPGVAEPLSGLVKSYVALNQADKALARLKQSVQKTPDFALAHNLIGEVLMIQKKPAEAEAAFEKSRAVNPKSVLPYRNLASLYLSQGKIDAAIQVYEQGVAATAGDSILAFGLATLHERKGHYDQAIALYEDMLRKEPTSQSAANNLAMVLVTHRNDTASLDRARDLVAPLKSSSNPAYLDTVGWVHYQRNEFDVAVPALQQALRAAPDEPLLRYHLGMALYKKGDGVAAKEHLQKAVEAKAAFFGLDDAKSTLARL